jgi:signal transduction histidine kinase
LQQVILNLCNNAAQAMDHIGRIELDVATFDLSAQRSLSHGVLAAGRYVRIAVSDSGRGIDPAAQARLFEPFFTTRLNGNGLGLATTRDIVRCMARALRGLAADLRFSCRAWMRNR